MSTVPKPTGGIGRTTFASINDQIALIPCWLAQTWLIQQKSFLALSKKQQLWRAK